MVCISDDLDPHNPPPLQEEDQKILTENTRVVKSVSESMERFRLSNALQETYDFVWNTFASGYIEEVKERIRSENKAGSRAAQWTLLTVFHTQLSLLHPFMPFLSEQIYQQFRISHPPWVPSELLMGAAWPQTSDE
jgi:valyl-tRNA synthetase